MFLMSGLPRSGSTLLSALLNQNSKLYVSPTSDLLELIVQARNNWVTCDAFKAQGIENLKPRIKDMLRGMIQGFYAQEIANGIKVVDNCRSWSGYIDLLENILEEKVKIICPIRDLKDIVASFEKLRHRNPLTAPHGIGPEYIQQQTCLGRAQHLLGPQGIVGLPYRRIVDAVQLGYGDRFMFVPYGVLLERAQSVCVQIFAYLNVKPCEIDSENIQGHSVDRDLDVWGLPLHTLRTSLDDQRQPWQDILPQAVGRWIDSEFASMQVLAQQ